MRWKWLGGPEDHAPALAVPEAANALALGRGDIPASASTLNRSRPLSHGLAARELTAAARRRPWLGWCCNARVFLAGYGLICTRGIMYLPAHFKEDRTPVLHDLIRAHPLAVLVTLDAKGLAANHIPMEIDAETGELGTLRGHVARANPVWKSHRPEVEAMAVF